VRIVFLPGCCNKCGCPCGFLPHTISLTFSDFPAKVPAPLDAGDTSTCFGSGATIGISAPGGADEDAGPIEAVFIKTPGQCYAADPRVPPDLTARVTSRPDITFDIQLEEAEFQCFPVWEVDSIKMAGSLPAGTSLVFSTTLGDTTLSVAKAVVAANESDISVTAAGRYYRQVTGERDRPIIRASSEQGVTLEPNIRFDGGSPPTWSVESLSIMYAGTDISGDTLGVTFTVGDRTIEQVKAEAFVEVEGGKATKAVVTKSGTYFRDTDLPPIVADVKFNISRPGGGGGAGASVLGIVDDDPNSKTYGQVVGLEIESAGDSYLGWKWTPPRCIDSLNGGSIVLRASDSTPLVRYCPEACFGSGGEAIAIRRTEPVLFGRFSKFDVGRVFLGDSGTVLRNFWLDRMQEVIDAGDEWEPSPGTEETAAEEILRLQAEFDAVSDFPETWSVSRFEDRDTLYEVGDVITLRVETPSGGLSASPPYRLGDVEVEAATIVVTEIEDDPVFTPQGYANKFSIAPGKYYRETLEWDGVADPVGYPKLINRGSGYAKIGREEPTLSAGTLTIDLSDQLADECGLPYWEVDKLSATPSSTGFLEGGIVTITTTGGSTEEVAAKIVVHTREQPEMTISAAGGSSPAAFSVTLAKSGPTVTGWPPEVQSAVWRIDEIAVQSAGEGYPPNSVIPLTIGVSAPSSGSGGAASAATDGDGRVVSATVTSGGEYYKDDGIPQEFTYVHKGEYYKENASLPSLVAFTTLAVVQTLPSDGKPPTISANIVTDPSSADFGKIDSLSAIYGDPLLWLSGPTNCVYNHVCFDGGTTRVISAIVGDGFVEITANANAVSDDALPLEDDTNIFRWVGLFRSDKVVSDCGLLPAGPYVSPYSASAGGITISAAESAYLPYRSCCLCPCDGGLDLKRCGSLVPRVNPSTQVPAVPEILVPRGIESIVVTLDIEVTPEEDDTDPCPNFSATLVLEDIRGNRWRAEDPELDPATQQPIDPEKAGQRWSIAAFLTCARDAGYLINLEIRPRVAEPDVPSPCDGENLLWVIPLPTQSLSPESAVCCPDGVEATRVEGRLSLSAEITVVEGS
jgi:hypothetical protein